MVFKKEKTIPVQHWWRRYEDNMPQRSLVKLLPHSPPKTVPNDQSLASNAQRHCQREGKDFRARGAASLLELVAFVGKFEKRSICFGHVRIQLSISMACSLISLEHT